MVSHHEKNKTCIVIFQGEGSYSVRLHFVCADNFSDKKADLACMSADYRRALSWSNSSFSYASLGKLIARNCEGAEILLDCSISGELIVGTCEEGAENLLDCSISGRESCFEDSNGSYNIPFLHCQGENIQLNYVM